jgi:CheY-like chemotaxis protein/predicted regulator of Ras-like GTPase activity (Roadblock/LC7/MglB family)
MPKVLIVDDSLSVRKVVERVLQSRELHVLQAGLGTEAIERIERDEPDLIVCDVLLPDKEGYEVCEFVRAHPRLGRTPVLLISGIVNPAVIERAGRVGSAGVMRKPFSATELTAKIEELLARTGRPASAPPAPPATVAPVTTSLALAAAGAPPNGTALAGSPNGMAPAATASIGPPAAAAPARLEPAPSLERSLAGLAAGEGVRAVVLADRAGLLMGAAGDTRGAALLGAMVGCLASAADELGAEAGRGSIQGLIVELDRGLALVSTVGASALLTLLLDEPAALGKARYQLKKTVPELLELV